MNRRKTSAVGWFSRLVDLERETSNFKAAIPNRTSQQLAWVVQTIIDAFESICIKLILIIARTCCITTYKTTRSSAKWVLWNSGVLVHAINLITCSLIAFVVMTISSAIPFRESLICLMVWWYSYWLTCEKEEYFNEINKQLKKMWSNQTERAKLICKHAAQHHPILLFALRFRPSVKILRGGFSILRRIWTLPYGFTTKFWHLHVANHHSLNFGKCD